MIKSCQRRFQKDSAYFTYRLCANWLPVSAATPLPGLEREVRKRAGKGELEIVDYLEEIAV